jgi:hypothetical protein
MAVEPEVFVQIVQADVGQRNASFRTRPSLHQDDGAAFHEPGDGRRPTGNRREETVKDHEQDGGAERLEKGSLAVDAAAQDRAEHDRQRTSKLALRPRNRRSASRSKITPTRDTMTVRAPIWPQVKAATAACHPNR